MHILTVTELTAHLQEVLDADLVLSDVWVQGEISNFSRASSGHCYFSLKENDAVLSAVMWHSQVMRLEALPTNGVAVLAHGYVSFYAAGGKLQLYVDLLQPSGIGELHARFEALKAQLQAEGLFEPARKRTLPALPHRIGIVTSEQGAALQDMLNILNRRCPLVEVLIAPCLVQGELAPQSIVTALQAIYATPVDVIIVARGGGSFEDLCAFNEEIVARAIFASPVPIITGVGHETDTTIVDYVADVRAPTPSAAAELVVPDRAELQQGLTGLRQQLDTAGVGMLVHRRQQLADGLDRLQQHSPLLRLPSARQQVDDLLRRAFDRMTDTIALSRTDLRRLQAQLDILSPRATLERGYAVVTRLTDGMVVTRGDQVAVGENVHIVFQADQVVAEIVQSTAEQNP